MDDSFRDRPFGCPLDIIVDVPPPPSVNKTRRIDWKNWGIYKAWRKHADGVLMMSGQVRGKKKHLGRFHLEIIIDEQASGIDPDNGIKALIDYLKRIELIEDDSRKYAREINVKYGFAPEGVRLVIKPMA